ncbi:hypothetical protein ACLB2K_006791 [Fragaria x ananassa]
MISVMATYLTGVWELSIVHAAQILNVYSGAVAILPLLMQLIFKAETLVSHSMVLFTRFAYTTGFAMLTMSAPPILSLATGTCTEEEAECIGQVQKILFYIGLTLIAVADCVHEVSAGEYSLTNLLTSASDTADEGFDEQYNAYGQTYQPSFCPTFCVALLSRTSLTLIPIVAIVAIGYIEAWWIKFGIPALFAVASLVVILFSSSKVNHRPPQQPSPLQEFFFEIISSEEGISPLWTATKLLLHIPMELCSFEPLLGTCVSMIFATLCCITAAKVETRRLSVVSTEGVIDEPDVIISMSIGWLIPQFILLGMAEGFSGSCIAQFFKQLPGRASIYSEGIAQSVNGVGVLCGVLSVYIVGQIQPTWFQSTLNTSRLDNYYWTLAALSAANLVLFPLGILLYLTALPQFHRDILKERFQRLLFWT